MTFPKVHAESQVLKERSTNCGLVKVVVVWLLSDTGGVLFDCFYVYFHKKESPIDCTAHRKILEGLSEYYLPISFLK